MKWTCNLGGRPELDSHGLYDTAREAVEKRFRTGHASTNLLIFTYDIESALTLAPSDRAKVAHFLTGVRVPNDKSWEFLMLSITDLDSCKKMEFWSLENWIELLVSTPTATAYRELYSMRARLQDGIWKAINSLFFHNYRTSSVSEYEVIAAIADVDPSMAKQFASYSDSVRSPSVLKVVVQQVDSLNAVVEDTDGATEAMEKLCRKALFVNYRTLHQSSLTSELEVSPLLQAVIDFGSHTLKQYIVDATAQECVFYTLTQDSISVNCFIMLKFVCRHLKTYPSDKLYLGTPSSNEPSVAWITVVEDLEFGGVIPLFVKGTIAQYNKTKDGVQDYAAHTAIAHIQDKITANIHFFLSGDDDEKEILSIIPEYVPPASVIVDILTHSIDTYLLKRVPVTDIVAVFTSSRTCIDHAFVDWNRALKGFSHREIRNIQRLITQADGDRIVASAPWIGRILE